MWLIAIAALLGAFSSFFALRALGAFVPSAMILLLGVYVYRERRIPALPRQALAVGAMFILLVLWGAWRSPDPDFALERVGKLFSYSLVALLLWALARDVSNFRHLRRLALTGFLLGLLVCLIEGISDGALFWIFKDVDRQMAAHATNRPVVVLCLMLWPALLCFGSDRLRASAWLLYGVTLLAAFGTESQSAQLAMIAGGAAAAVAQWRPVWALWLVGSGGVAVLLGLPFALSVLDVHRVGDMAIGDAVTVHARLELWIYVAGKILQQPVTGYGLEIGRYMVLDDMPRQFFHGIRMHHPHNGVLQIWFELGLIGALAASAAWIYLFRTLAGLSGGVQAAALGAVTYAFTVSTVSHGLWQSWWIAAMIWLPVLFLICLGKGRGDAEAQTPPASGC